MARKYEDLRKRVVELRKEGASLNDLLERFRGIPKGTLYYWIREHPLQKESKEGARRRTKGAKAGNESMVNKYQKIRQQAYQQGTEEFTSTEDRRLRDFALLYWAEGYKKTRHTVSICNSDPCMVLFGNAFLKDYTEKALEYWLQYHKDQDVLQLKQFWAKLLDIDPETIRVQRKSNSGGMKGRKWRSEHGVLTVRLHSTKLRARVQGWIDALKRDLGDTTSELSLATKIVLGHIKS